MRTGRPWDQMAVSQPRAPHLAPGAFVQKLAQLATHRLAQHVQIHTTVGQVSRHLGPAPFQPQRVRTSYARTTGVVT